MSNPSSPIWFVAYRLIFDVSPPADDVLSDEPLTFLNTTGFLWILISLSTTATCFMLLCQANAESTAFLLYYKLYESQAIVCALGVGTTWKPLHSLWWFEHNCSKLPRHHESSAELSRYWNFQGEISLSLRMINLSPSRVLVQYEVSTSYVSSTCIITSMFFLYKRQQ